MKFSQCHLCRHFTWRGVCKNHVYWTRFGPSFAHVITAVVPKAPIPHGFGSTFVFHDKRHPMEMGTDEVGKLFSCLAIERDVLKINMGRPGFRLRAVC